LTVQDSFTVWKLLGFYGHIILSVAFLFFFLGGASFCKKLQARRGLPPPKVKANGIGTGETTPIQEKNFTLPPPIDEIVPFIEGKG